MTRWTWLFGEERRQRIVIQRSLTAALVYAVCLAVLWWSVAEGLADEATARWLSVVVDRLRAETGAALVSSSLPELRVSISAGLAPVDSADAIEAALEHADRGAAPRESRGAQPGLHRRRRLTARSGSARPSTVA